MAFLCTGDTRHIVKDLRFMCLLIKFAQLDKTDSIRQSPSSFPFPHITVTPSSATALTVTLSLDRHSDYGPPEDMLVPNSLLVLLFSSHSLSPIKLVRN